MPLFNLSETEFVLHSGGRSRLLVDCSTLTEDDWQGIAWALAGLLPAFGEVFGVPRGGLPLAKALRAYCRQWAGLVLVCDDVLTTGRSMGEARAQFERAGRGVVGAVVFARRPCPSWVVPLLRMDESRTE